MKHQESDGTMSQELQIELAAKAVGLVLPNPALRVVHMRGCSPPIWNPATSQADSDKMACDLEIETVFDIARVVCAHFGDDDYEQVLTERSVSHDNTTEGRRAAVRQARLLVAAEIGREMK